MMASTTTDWLDEGRIADTLARSSTVDSGQIQAILTKARELKGLAIDEVAALLALEQPDLLAAVFETARWVKNEIYGRRIVMFAPLYYSNSCCNECVYCAFRRSNRELARKTLSQAQIARETAALIDQGHKRLLLIAGESVTDAGFQHLLDAIATVYSVKRGSGEIRRVNVNVAPLSVEEFRALKAAGIGTYQLFQETYHRKTYAEVHIAGRKSDFDWRLNAIDRAMEAGIDDVGIGPLLGLADWRFDLLAMMQHIAHLEERFGVGCHTISVPRMEPALGSTMSEAPPHHVTDADFKKIVAVLRLAVPYTGIIMSTRETAEMRRDTFSLGVSQVSGGSRTDPGGYADAADAAGAAAAAAAADDAGQFQVGDHRSLDDVVRDIAEVGFTPSFCTACYRMGRTGRDFMDLAKPGLIREMCGPNALSTFVEYLEDYASPATVEAGERAIRRELDAMDPKIRHYSEIMIAKVRDGKRDVFR
ncbi:MAG: [FeFe] hydrogenase H-cluster radical SAM maturase HydG [Azospirillaceae bacterium]|nr:[FeFe] hydrogenase H-cluster radical SAM maturase HydG [Azospirillaceae bacterium]